MNSLEPYKNVILELRQRPTSFRIICENLARDYKIPIDINSDSTCNIPAQSHLAELIRETQLVF